MMPLMSETTINKEQADLDGDFAVFASIDFSSDDEDPSDENDALNVSCHGNHFKRMKEEPKHVDKFTIKRRKLQTQMDLMNSILMSVKFGETDGERSTSFVPCNKHAGMRKIPTKRRARKTKTWSWSTRKFAQFVIAPGYVFQPHYMIWTREVDFTVEAVARMDLQKIISRVKN